MNHMIKLTTEEAMELIGVLEIMSLEAPKSPIERLSEQLKGRVYFDLKEAENEREKWRKIDDDL